MANFFHCVRTRAADLRRLHPAPHASVPATCRTSRCGWARPLAWDPAREDFVGDAQASALLGRPQRPGYTLREMVA